MKQNELNKALRIIAGDTRGQRGGLHAVVAKNLGVAHITVKNWSSKGLPASKAALVWNAAGKQVDLAKLVMEGGA